MSAQIFSVITFYYHLVVTAHYLVVTAHYCLLLPITTWSQFSYEDETLLFAIGMKNVFG